MSFFFPPSIVFSLNLGFTCFCGWSPLLSHEEGAPCSSSRWGAGDKRHWGVYSPECPLSRITEALRTAAGRRQIRTGRASCSWRPHVRPPGEPSGGPGGSPRPILPMRPLPADSELPALRFQNIRCAVAVEFPAPAHGGFKTAHESEVFLRIICRSNGGLWVRTSVRSPPCYLKTPSPARENGFKRCFPRSQRLAYETAMVTEQHSVGNEAWNGGVFGVGGVGFDFWLSELAREAVLGKSLRFFLNLFPLVKKNEC